MIEFFKDNAVWLTPVFVAIVSGVFYLLKRGGSSNKQTIKNVTNSHINQAGGNINDKEDERNA
jgi:hypothetical protein